MSVHPTLHRAPASRHAVPPRSATPWWQRRRHSARQRCRIACPLAVELSRLCAPCSSSAAYAWRRIGPPAHSLLLLLSFYCPYSSCYRSCSHCALTSPSCHCHAHGKAQPPVAAVERLGLVQGPFHCCHRHQHLLWFHPPRPAALPCQQVNQTPSRTKPLKLDHVLKCGSALIAPRR